MLFVSHNMEAILKLCTTGIFFEVGLCSSRGDVKTIVPAYLRSQSSSPRVVDFLSKARPGQYMGKAHLSGLLLQRQEAAGQFPLGNSFRSIFR